MAHLFIGIAREISDLLAVLRLISSFLMCKTQPIFPMCEIHTLEAYPFTPVMEVEAHDNGES